jgi:hypothetical protein
MQARVDPIRTLSILGIMHLGSSILDVYNEGRNFLVQFRSTPQSSSESNGIGVGSSKGVLNLRASSSLSSTVPCTFAINSSTAFFVCVEISLSIESS